MGRNIMRNREGFFDDDAVYLAARASVEAKIQYITMYEWLPSIGIELPEYTGFNPDVDPTLSNEFSHAVFRMGHSLVPITIDRMKETGPYFNSSLKLREAFFQ